MKVQSPQMGNGLRIIVYEHVSGGGYAGQSIPLDILAEGFGMLRNLVTDLKAAGHETTVLLDGRLSNLNPPIDADCIKPVFAPDEPKRLMADIAKINDAIYVIAPETDQTLRRMVEFSEGISKVSLNCKSGAIEKASNKAALYEMLADRGFPIPQTLTRNIDEPAEELSQAIKNELSYPVLFKPVDGASCSGISIVANKNSLEAALSKIKRVSTNKHFIIQEYVKGFSTSASVLSNGKKARAISINYQSINLAEPYCDSKYDGGYVPFNHPLRGNAAVLAEQVVESIPGLRGYVGVDLVLTNDDVFFVDMNPRLTTSYVGLHNVAGFNIAAALIDAVINGKLPHLVENHGVACFSKVATNAPSISAFQQATKLGFVVTPPFPLENNTKSTALVVGKGNSLEEAELCLEEAKKNLIDIVI
jgi:tyramine---L-glutamate ligase